MWCPSKSVLDAVEPGAAFVASRWHELFDEFTPDTFHPKLYGLSSLAAEATMIGQLHEDHDAWFKHLKQVQAELSEALRGGVEVAGCSKRHITMLDEMAKSQSARQVFRLGRVLHLEEFHRTLEERIRLRFTEFDITRAKREKERADELLTSLATFAFRKGCSRDDTGNVDEVLPAGTDAVQKWILNCLPNNQQEFDCIVAVAAREPDAQSAIRSVTDALGFTRVGVRFPGLPNDPNFLFLRRRASAFRASEAIEALRSELRAPLNLLALYKQSSAASIHETGWMVENNRANPVPRPTPSFRNLHPRKSALELANNAAKSLGNRSDEAAIQAALDLHNLALSMADHRLRLVNLWSALECLASLTEGESIIARVERLVCPILAWRKPEKLVRYLTISFHFWLKGNPEIDRSALPFGLGDHGVVAADRILTLLTEEKNSPGIRSLLKAVCGHPLLLYRINKAWELFHDSKALCTNLNESKRRLGWHLWRIYRARNLLVHQGIEPDCLPQLANHLQQYLSWTLSRLLHGLSFGPGWTAVDSLCLWQAKSEHLINSLKSHPELLTLGDIFPEQIHDPLRLVYPTRP